MQTKHSLCIPRIENSISKEYIFNVFTKLKIGYIEFINEIPLRNDAKHKRVIIKLRWNETNKTAQNMLSRLDKNETIKLVHDMPWYWKVVSTTPQK
jgi:hypothetical protein